MVKSVETVGVVEAVETVWRLGFEVVEAVAAVVAAEAVKPPQLD
jgi:hypothetical protein